MLTSGDSAADVRLEAALSLLGSFRDSSLALMYSRRVFLIPLRAYAEHFLSGVRDWPLLHRLFLPHVVVGIALYDAPLASPGHAMRQAPTGA